MFSARPTAILLLFLYAATVSCTSRYRLDLHMTLGEETRSMRVEDSHYFPDTRLGDPMSERRVVPGEAATLVVRSSTRGMPLPTGEEVPTGLSFDEFLKTDLYIELPSPPTVATLSLAGRSFVQILERYDQPLEAKIFLPDDGGELAIDSITARYLFATIRGNYANADAQPLVLSGSFRVRLPD